MDNPAAVVPTSDDCTPDLALTPAVDSSSLASNLLCLELCGGSARLTRALLDRGFECMAIDWHRNGSKPEGPSVLLDLTTAHAQQLLLSLVAKKRILFAHCAPPCGTASRARDRPLPASLQKQGAPCPEPLRSAAYPHGLPHLRGTDRVRVDTAS